MHLPGEPTKVREIKSYEMTEHSARFVSHWGSFVETDEKHYQQAWRGHGPFVTLGIFDNGITPIPRAKVVLTLEQARALALDLLERTKNL